MVRRIALLTMFPLLLVLLSLGAGGPASAQTGLFDGQNIASDTYYRLDPEAGTMTVRIEARVQNATGDIVPEALFMMMPGAEDISVQMDGEDVEHELLFDDADSGAPAADPIIEQFLASDLYTVDFLTVTPERGLVPNVEHRFTVTYTLSARQNELMSIEPGAIEAALVSQGPGSFLFVDLPQEADNYLDPGCLLASNQPGDVVDDGFERWICGETALIALSTDNPAVLAECAAAAPNCRQKLPVEFGGFAQSITDEALKGSLSATIEMANGPVELHFEYFKRSTAWAQREFEVAKTVIPMLEELFGFPYEFETITLRESNYLEFSGYAGVAFSRVGVALVAPVPESYLEIADHVTVHELAHQWAGNQLAAPWVWEGLAEWATRIIDARLGYQEQFGPWQDYGMDVPLTRWGSNDLPPDYWYRKAGDFWFAFEEAIGGRANMTAVLAGIGEEQENWPLRERWFHDRAEQMFDVNLDEVFLDWMYVPQTAEPLLAERRAVWGEVAALEAKAATVGLPGVPQVILDDLVEWEFNAARSRVTEASGLLDTYAAVLAKANANAMPRADATLREAWIGQPLHQVAEMIRLKEHAIDAIVAARGALSDEEIPEASRLALEEAVTLYEQGSFTAAATAASGTVNELSLTRDAEALLIEAETRDIAFQPNFFERVGLLGSNPTGDLERARTALESGDPQEAIRLSHAAMSAWDGAQAGGALRLAVTAGLLCLAIVVVYFAGAIKRAPDAVNAKRPTKGDAPGSTISPEFRAFLDVQERGKTKAAQDGGPGAGDPAPGAESRSMRTHGTLRQQLRNNRGIQGDEHVTGGD